MRYRGVRNPKSENCRIFLLQDDVIFRKQTSKVLHEEEGLTVCGESGDVQQALESIRELKPDIVAVDVGVPDNGRLEVVRKIRSVNTAGKLLAISTSTEASFVQRALNAGADGYIMKQHEPDEIVHAVRDVVAGHIYVSEGCL